MRRRPSFTRRLFRPYWRCTEQNTKGSCPETSPLVPNPTPGSWSYVPLKIHWRIAVLNGLSVDIHKQFIAHIVGSIVLHSISNNLCEPGNSQTCCAVLLYRSLPVLVHRVENRHIEMLLCILCVDTEMLHQSLRHLHGKFLQAPLEMTEFTSCMSLTL